MRVRVEHSIDAATALPGHSRCGALHGHTYKLELEVEGSAKAGILVDFRELKRALVEACAPYDHADLSQRFDYPSCEALCEALYTSLSARYPSLDSLRVWEGEGKWVEMRRGED
jgi:6-pyruvoyltetrahydropterin/6-carboxytetrahydropterin synthase